MSKRVGDLGELAFMLKAKKSGLALLTPYSSNSSYDLAVDNGKQILKIQVKTTNTVCLSHGKRQENVYKVIVSKGTTGKKPYEAHEVDYFAVYVMPEDVFYIIPFDEINTLTIKLHTDKMDHKFSKYMENWNILK